MPVGISKVLGVKGTSEKLEGIGEEKVVKI
jgi:hypothetical protein